MAPHEQQKQDGLSTPKVVANIAACVAQKTKTRLQRSPITWTMFPTERTKENSTATQPLRFQNSLLTQTTNNTEGEKTKTIEELIFVPNESMLPGLWQKLPRCCSTDPLSAAGTYRERVQCGAEAAGRSWDWWSGFLLTTPTNGRWQQQWRHCKILQSLGRAEEFLPWATSASQAVT